MKLFTLKEANDLLVEIIPKIEAISRSYKLIRQFDPEVRSAAAASHFGGGMVGGSTYVNELYKAGKLMTDITELGVEMKDPERGLIDFPSLRDGEVVLLCWQLGEGDVIEFWHSTDGGFDGRKPI